MTISTKPEDINSPETILYYMDSYPASGQNRAAAKLIRELLAAAPLVAATDNSKRNGLLWNSQWVNIVNHDHGYESYTKDDAVHHAVQLTESAITKNLTGQVAPQAILPENIISGALFDLMGFLTTRDEVTTLSSHHEAGPAVEALRAFADKRQFNLDEAKVADWIDYAIVQATVEPLTDADIDVIARPFVNYCVASGSREFNHQGFARTLLATPLTSKVDYDHNEGDGLAGRMQEANKPEFWVIEEEYATGKWVRIGILDNKPEAFVDPAHQRARAFAEVFTTSLTGEATERRRISTDESEPDFWPIAKLTVTDGNIADAAFYAPGLPDGVHDVFPAPTYLDEHTAAWYCVVQALDAAVPGWQSQAGKNGIESATQAIQKLAIKSPSNASEPDSGFVCSDCGAKLRAGYVCDVCDSFGAVESESTSKADTVEAIRNAALEDAVCDLERHNMQLCAQHNFYLCAAADIHALKSATPSTIKVDRLPSVGKTIVEQATDKHPSALSIAGIAGKHFAYPIPPAAYAFASELIAATLVTITAEPTGEQ